jgi:hypothetical protein
MTLAEMDDLIDRELTSLPGWCTFPKSKRLVRIAHAWAQSAPEGELAVELGVYGGRSLISLALGLKLAGKGMIDGIDSWRKEEPLEGEQSDVDKQLWDKDTDFELLLDRTLDGLKRFDVLKYVQIIVRSGDDAVGDYKDGSIGLMHLDGNHSTLVSCRDVTIWLPKMTPRAVWILDDTNWPSMKPALGLVEQGGFRLVEQGAEGYWSVYAR